MRVAAQLGDAGGLTAGEAVLDEDCFEVGRLEPLGVIVAEAVCVDGVGDDKVQREAGDLRQAAFELEQLGDRELLGMVTPT
jgi:hypothetical protein